MLETGKTEMEERIELFTLARKYSNTSHPNSGRQLVERHFNVPLHGYAEWVEQCVQDEELERELRREQDREDIAAITRKQLGDKARRAVNEAAKVGAV